MIEKREESPTENKKYVCGVCGNPGGNSPYFFREMMFGLGGRFEYFQCAQCGCMQICGIPEDMAAYYGGAYYSFSPLKEGGNLLKRRFWCVRDRYALFKKGAAGRALNLLRPNALAGLISGAVSGPDSSVLDVGCGAGRLLYSLREAGMERVAGIDPFIGQDITYSNGLRIFRRTIYEAWGQWDLIIMNNSFEHMPEPAKVLACCRDHLSQNGCVMIMIPVIDCWGWEHYRENYVHLDAPRHFFIPSVHSMQVLAGRAGMRIEKTACRANIMQFLGSEQYLRGIPLQSENSWSVNPGRSIFSKREVKRFKRRAQKLCEDGTGAERVFYLKKN